MLRTRLNRSCLGVRPTGWGRLLASLCLLVCVVALAPVGADTLLLTNGDRIEGTIYSEDDKEVVIVESTPGGDLLRFVPKRDIRTIQRGENTGAPAQGPAATTKKNAGYILCSKAANVSSKDMAAALVNAIQDSIAKKDDLTIVIFDGLELDPAGARVVAEAVALASMNAGGQDLVALVRSVNEGTAVLALTFPRILVGTNARIRGFRPGSLNPQERGALLRPMQSTSPKRIALGEALCDGKPVAYSKTSGWHFKLSDSGSQQFSPRTGVHEFTAFDLVSTKTAVATCSKHTEVPGVLGNNKRHTFRNRPLRKGRQAQPARDKAKDLEEKITRFNDGLAQAKGGIQEIKKVWQYVEPYWKSGGTTRGTMPATIRTKSTRAQSEIDAGLGKAIRAAQFMERFLDLNDPRIKAAISMIVVMQELEGATKRNREVGYLTLCKKVLDFKPL